MRAVRVENITDFSIPVGEFVIPPRAKVVYFSLTEDLFSQLSERALYDMVEYEEIEVSSTLVSEILNVNGNRPASQVAWLLEGF